MPEREFGWGDVAARDAGVTAVWRSSYDRPMTEPNRKKRAKKRPFVTSCYGRFYECPLEDLNLQPSD